MLKPQPLRILFVTPVSPFGQSAGGQLRSSLLLEALQKLGTVDLLVLQRKQQVSAVAESLTPYGNLVSVSLPGWRALKSRLAVRRVVADSLPQPAGRYDLVVIRYLWPIWYLGLSRSTPLVADLDDFDFRFQGAMLQLPGFWWLFVKKRVARLFSRSLLPRMAGAFFVSEKDRACAPSKLRAAVLHNVPPRLDSPTVRHSDGQTVLMVGSMWYRPNKEAADWLIAHVWPMLRRERANVRLLIVGAAPPEQIGAWSAIPGVTALGYVDCLDSLYASAALVVVPVHSGGGTNIKLLEALSHSCPCVSSCFSYRPFEHKLRVGEHLLTGHSAQDFGSACLKILGDAQLAQRLGEAGRTVVLKDFSAEAFIRDATTFLTQVLRSEH